MTVYDFSVPTPAGQERSLAVYQGKVLLIVNTASNCGFTPQYHELEELYRRYGKQGFIVLAFPCNQFWHQEPGDNEQIQNFCQLNYGVTFPVFAKIEVNGPDAHPLFRYLTEQAPGWFGKAIRWNFTKFLIDSSGHIRKRYAPLTNPLTLSSAIENLLAELPHSN